MPPLTLFCFLWLFILALWNTSPCIPHNAFIPFPPDKFLPICQGEACCHLHQFCWIPVRQISLSLHRTLHLVFAVMSIPLVSLRAVIDLCIPLSQSSSAAMPVLAYTRYLRDFFFKKRHVLMNPEVDLHIPEIVRGQSPKDCPWKGRV